MKNAFIAELIQHVWVIFWPEKLVQRHQSKFFFFLNSSAIFGVHSEFMHKTPIHIYLGTLCFYCAKTIVFLSDSKAAALVLLCILFPSGHSMSFCLMTTIFFYLFFFFFKGFRFFSCYCSAEFACSVLFYELFFFGLQCLTSFSNLTSVNHFLNYLIFYI